LCISTWIATPASCSTRAFPRFSRRHRNILGEYRAGIDGHRPAHRWPDNIGQDLAFATSGVLSTESDVVILEDQADFGNVLPGAQNSAIFWVQFPEGSDCEDPIDFQLELEFTDSEALPWTLTVPLTLSPKPDWSVVPWLDNWESGAGDWSIELPSGTLNWSIVVADAPSPTHAWHVEGEAGIQDARLITPESDYTRERPAPVSTTSMISNPAMTGCGGDPVDRPNGMGGSGSGHQPKPI